MTTELATRQTQELSRQDVRIGIGEQAALIAAAESFGKLYLDSGLLPKGFPKTWQSVALVAMEGHAIGMTFSQAMRDIYVFNNTPYLSSDGMLALARRSGVFDESEYRVEFAGEGDSRKCSVTMARKGGKPMTSTYSIGDAKNAGLLTKDNWRLSPSEMLRHRATAVVAKALFADVIRGIPVQGQEGPLETTVVESNATHSEPVSESRSVELLLEALPPASVPIPSPAEPKPRIPTEIEELAGIVRDALLEKHGGEVVAAFGEFREIASCPKALDFDCFNKLAGTEHEAIALEKLRAAKTKLSLELTQ